MEICVPNESLASSQLSLWRSFQEQLRDVVRMGSSVHVAIVVVIVIVVGIRHIGQLHDVLNSDRATILVYDCG